MADKPGQFLTHFADNYLRFYYDGKQAVVSTFTEKYFKSLASTSSAILECLANC